MPISIPEPQPSSLAVVLLCLAACGAALHVVATARLRRHLRRNDGEQGAHTPPLTLWRAIKPGVRDLPGKLDALVHSSRPGDQILVGVEPASAELTTSMLFRDRFPGRDIAVVACDPAAAANPKIAKFIQMAPLARHEHWLLTDSEALLDTAFVEAFRQEWASSDADAQTAGYRYSGLKNIRQILDTSPALLTLWPGVMLAPKIDFTLGACVAVKASDVQMIGGWDTLASELAEDRHLGRLLAQAGRKIALSRHVLTLDNDAPGWTDYFRHQHRGAVTYRVAAPAGALGLPVLHTLGLAALAIALHPPWWKWAAMIAVIRITSAWVVSRLLKFSIPILPLGAVLSAAVESIMWFAAWFSPCVWWSGSWRRVTWRGRLRPQPPLGCGTRFASET